ncbi:NAD(P)-dependent dehydrogenase, short-chain alcohol dehydrogenase family [Halogranum gelatinilyticum]|uniref:NAD(P)-dependent dehydrogenase, short-chain alcohol dehydrogenase family n=1 Tax=Halogranum gelatinilyticum TaxID=660521 RepID=A0A1G9ZSS5_9EURY|nr:SDR family NAD(P)-dependent oxidoreductase [Halogranum gelatinilyticum]SDN24489.1 NAD(P)-dependent dehydrogenase, short-chain alcohol dehydrogenase family [Halogranum gelatinilyticum]
MVSDSIAVVTGGGRGIGQAICTRLAQDGADVVIADLDADEMQETKRLVEAEGQRALAVETDVSEQESVRSTVDRVLDEFGQIDILVNNAGIAGPTSPCEEIEQTEWDATMDVNLRGPFFMCREILPVMKDRGFGRIVNISSVTGKKPLLNRTPYAATKMGLIGFTRTLALEVGEYDINVNAICPGSVDGPRIRGVFEQQAEATGRSYDDVRAETEAQSPRNELVQREDIASVAAYLCSEEAARITGQDINVSAGKVMY